MLSGSFISRAYHQYITSISPVYNRYITNTSTVHMWLNLREQFRKFRNHKYITSIRIEYTVSPIYHQHVTSISPVYHQYTTSISPVCHHYITNTSTVHMWLNLREQFRKFRNHKYITSTQYITNMSPVSHQHITGISPVHLRSICGSTFENSYKNLEIALVTTISQSLV